MPFCGTLEHIFHGTVRGLSLVGGLHAAASSFHICAYGVLLLVGVQWRRLGREPGLGFGHGYGYGYGYGHGHGHGQR